MPARPCTCSPLPMQVRLQTQTTYRGIVDCAIKILRHESVGVCVWGTQGRAGTLGESLGSPVGGGARPPQPYLPLPPVARFPVEAEGRDGPCILSPLPVTSDPISRQVLGFFKGMSFPLASVALVNSVLFGVYSNTLLALTATSHQQRRAQPPSYTHIFIAGCTGGVLQVRGPSGRPFPDPSGDL